jgi:D-glycero-alpha-D-manno-heptose-7-phosphate kinase
MVEEAISIINSNPVKIDDFGKLLNEAWRLKQRLSSKITNRYIDEIYDAAMDSGALGGKLLGAGGGGFMLLFVKPKHQPKVRQRLKKLLYVPFKFENLGSQIIYYTHDNNL